MLTAELGGSKESFLYCYDTAVENPTTEEMEISQSPTVKGEK